MAQGLRIWDDSGNLIVDTSTNCSQQLGVLNLSDGHSSGSFTDANLSSGRPYAFVVMSSVSGGSTFRKWTDVSVSGTTITYSAGDSCSIIYGVF